MNLTNLSTNATTREAARRVLIVGASARAAAASACRAGLLPLAIDRFNDVDLAELCERCQTYRSAAEIPRLADEFPEADWIYTGPFENHPRVLRSLAEKRRLLGNDFETVKQVRDPWHLHACLQDAGLASPRVHRSFPTGAGTRWLKKPLRSGGGCGIVACPLPGIEPREQMGKYRPGRRHYYQQYVKGTSYSAVFVATDRQAVLLGATEQLIGTRWNAIHEFQYAGSVGPVTFPADVETRLRQVGARLSEHFGLRGLFGVDFILSANDVWPVEVNPRYSASVEAIEIATTSSLLRWHVEACQHQRLPAVMPAPEFVSGKLILYATRGLTMSLPAIEALAGQVLERGAGVIADVPRAGTELNQGDPICTVLVQGSSIRDAKGKLAAVMAA